MYWYSITKILHTSVRLIEKNFVKSVFNQGSLELENPWMRPNYIGSEKVQTTANFMQKNLLSIWMILSLIIDHAEIMKPLPGAHFSFDKIPLLFISCVFFQQLFMSFNFTVYQWLQYSWLFSARRSGFENMSNAIHYFFEWQCPLLLCYKYLICINLILNVKTVVCHCCFKQ